LRARPAAAARRRAREARRRRGAVTPCHPPSSTAVRESFLTACRAMPWGAKETASARSSGRAFMAFGEEADA
jgi:hypothetical protein